MSTNTPKEPQTPQKSKYPQTPHTYKSIHSTEHSPSSLITRKHMRLPDDYIESNFQPSTTYRFGHVNLISIRRGHVYDLLEKSIPKKVVNCNCLKSQCNVNYCDCFRSGQVCNEQCHCKNCQNHAERQITPIKAAEPRCNCVKTQCLKKYCECLQKGQRCGEKCGCVGCKNQPQRHFP